MKYKLSAEQTFEDGQIIFDEGSEDENVYVVLSGAVKIIKEVRGENLVVEVIRQGDVFGEMAFVAHLDRSATAKAVGPTVVGILDRQTLAAEFDALSPILKRIMESLVARLKKATDNSLGVSHLRREPRVSRSINVSFQDGHRFLETACRDASCGGMFIRTDSPLGEGQVFFLDLAMSRGETPMRIKCQVAWVRSETNDPEKHPVGMGVKFLKMSERDQERLKEELERIGTGASE